MFRLIVALCFLASILAENHCPEVPRQKNFDFDKLNGTWYLQVVFSTAVVADEKCFACRFIPDKEPPAVSITLIDPNSHEYSTISYNVTVNNDSETAEVSFMRASKSEQEKWIVVRTDYTDELILHACKEKKSKGNLHSLFWRRMWKFHDRAEQGYIGSKRGISVNLHDLLYNLKVHSKILSDEQTTMILYRTEEPDLNKVPEAETFLNGTGINVHHIMVVDHSNCES